MCDIQIFDTLEVPSDSPVIFIKQLLQRKEHLFKYKGQIRSARLWKLNMKLAVLVFCSIQRKGVTFILLPI